MYEFTHFCCFPSWKSTKRWRLNSDFLSNWTFVSASEVYFSIPTGQSCSERVRLLWGFPPGLHAGISRFCPGWRGGRAPGAPRWNPPGPLRPNTPARLRSRTRTGRPRLQDNPMSKAEGGKSFFMNRWPLLTFDVVGPAAELQSEDVVDGSAGVQRVGVLVVADESVLSSEDQHGSVDELQGELLVFTWDTTQTTTL